MQPCKQFSILILLLAILIFSGCETLYIPNAVHSPMLTNKGEGHISTSIGLIGSGLANIDVAYAVTKHMGIMADGMYHYKSFIDPYNLQSADEQTSIYYGSLGAGYYGKIGKNENLVLQFYGGGGYGDTHMHYDYETESDLTANYYNIYAQPGLVFKIKHVDFGFDCRVNYVQLYNFNKYLYDYYFESQFPYLFRIEPNFTVMIGGKHLKGKLQSGFTIPTYYYTSDFNVAYIYKLNVGISYIFGRKETQTQKH